MLYTTLGMAAVNISLSQFVFTWIKQRTTFFSKMQKTSLGVTVMLRYIYIVSLNNIWFWGFKVD